MVDKISKKDFLHEVCRKGSYNYDDVSEIYDAIVDGVKDVMRRGQRLTLTGFGTFYVAKHKGHPVQFDTTDGETIVEDYVVFKFSSSDVLSKELRDDYRNGRLIVKP